jgi:hypothetical protein
MSAEERTDRVDSAESNQAETRSALTNRAESRAYRELITALRRGMDGETYKAREDIWEALVEQGQAALEGLFPCDPTEQWCKRRAISLEFIEERRGQWTLSIDFAVPASLSKLALTTDPDTLFLPLMTFNKDLLPPAQLHTKDAAGVTVPLAASSASRDLAFGMLCGAAGHAGVCPRCRVNDLWTVTASDTLGAERAYRALRGDSRVWAEPCPSHGLKASPGSPELRRFVSLVRLTRLVVFLTFEIPISEVGQRKNVTVDFDGPIRVIRRLPEWLGWTPLVLAPRAAFGGDAKSYHLELRRPPQRVTVVDSRLLYSYYSPSDLGQHSGTRRSDPDEVDEVLLEGVELRASNDIEGVLASPGLSSDEPVNQWWGSVEGPAEPMSAHIRCDRQRLPPLLMGRDAMGVFHFYPQFMGLLSQFVMAGVLNFAFVSALIAGLAVGALRDFTADQPEAILIIAVLVAGVGVGLTFYPSEHLLTSSVLRPWRRLIASLVGLTIAAPITAAWGWRKSHMVAALHPPWIALWIELGLAALLVAYLLAICVRPLVAETTGSRRYETTGLRLRRQSFPDGKALDDAAILQHELDRDHAWLDARERARRSKREELRRRFADQYLIETSRRHLFNRGIPPAIRHVHDQRGG